MNWTSGGQVALRTMAATTGDLYLVDADGKNFAEVAQGAPDKLYLPELSPDGQYAFYFQRQPNTVDWKLFRLDLEDGTRRLLSDEFYRQNNFLMTFSADGKRAAFLLTLREVVVVDIDGRHAHLLHPDKDVIDMTFAPDGEHLLFVEQDPAGAQSVYMTDLDGNNRNDLGIQGGYQALSDFAFSPDGTQLIFASTDIDKQSDIYLADADGSSVQRLTFSPDMDAFPIWQPGR
jgi:TolB protein